MKHVGYGVIKDGLPVGIWPMDFEAAKAARERYRLKYQGASVEAVPIEIGEPIKFPDNSGLSRVLAHAGTLRKLPDDPELA